MGIFFAVFGVIIVIFIIVAFLLTRKGAKMKDGYSSLRLGMSKQEVFDLFGEPSGQRVNGITTTYIWRQSEFKGFARGGTKQRSVVVDFVDDKVVGFDSDNMDMSVF